MKNIIILILTLSIIPVSIFTMIFGWGLTAENWGWISFGYLWMLVGPALISLLK